MLCVCWCLSGEELVVLPSEELPDVRTLKKVLHERHGAPPRFRQAILENGCRMADDCSLMQVTQVQLLLLDFVPWSDGQVFEIFESVDGSNPERLEDILQRPTDPNVASFFAQPFHRTPLLYAAHRGRAACLDLLLEASADTEMRADDRGIQWITPLNCAAYFGHVQCVRSLLSHGADMHAEGTTRCPGGIVHTSSLCLACMAGHEDVALFLVQSGAASDLRELLRALRAARRGGLQTSELVQLLLQKQRRKAWSADDEHVTFTAGEPGVEAGAEVFNNYGDKSNEDLLLIHGFALLDNIFDTYGLWLSVQVSEEPPTQRPKKKRRASPKTQRIGPFLLRRSDPRWDQFPAELWLALSSASSRETPAAGEGATHLAVEPDHLRALSSLLQQRLEDFTATKTRDRHFASGGAAEGGALDPRIRYIARYRDGQRQVLEDCAKALDEMLSQLPEEPEATADEETVSQFLDQYFGYGWARWRCPFDYVPDYTRGEYSTSEFAVLTAQVDDFRVDDFFDVDDLWSWWLPINGTFIWAMYTPPDTDNGIRTVSFWKIVRSQQNGRYVHIGDNYVWQPADNSQFNPEYAEREVLEPNWCIQSIPGIQKSYMQIGKWTCNRIGVATPEFRKRKIFILEMTHEPGRHSQRRPSLTLIKFDNTTIPEELLRFVKYAQY
ncbi:secG [Symbiodinium sp. CCMP2592]|nr:secG [Symbiodinium sp. CCMP2592]